MRIEKLFHVIVVAGASTAAGLAGCGDEKTEERNAGGSNMGGSGGSNAGTGGTSGGSGGGADACEAVCGPSPTFSGWTDCDGCCCWLPVGVETTQGAPTCPEEPCCIGRGRD